MRILYCTAFLGFALVFTGSGFVFGTIYSTGRPYAQCPKDMGFHEFLLQAADKK